MGRDGKVRLFFVGRGRRVKSMCDPILQYFHPVLHV